MAVLTFILSIFGILVGIVFLYVLNLCVKALQIYIRKNKD